MHGSVMCLRKQLAKSRAKPDRLHRLAACILCATPEELRHTANWPGAGPASRQRVAEELQASVLRARHTRRWFRSVGVITRCRSRIWEQSGFGYTSSVTTFARNILPAYAPTYAVQADHPGAAVPTRCATATLLCITGNDTAWRKLVSEDS